MVRKVGRHKNGSDRKETNHKQPISEPVDASLSEEKEKLRGNCRNDAGKELLNGDNLCRSGRERVNDTNSMGSGKRNKKRSCNVPHSEKTDDGTFTSAEVVDMLNNMGDFKGNDLLSDPSELRGNDTNMTHSMSEKLSVENEARNIGPSDAVPGQSIKDMALYVLNAANGWLEQQKPRLSIFTAYMTHARDYVVVQIKHMYPIIWTWILHSGKLIFLLSVVWLDSNFRGINSLVRLGTTSFFTVIWCSILSLVAMVGITKVLMLTVIAGVVAAFIGLVLAMIIIAIFATIILWLYGSFWTTGLVVFIGGISFALSHEQIALLVTTIYSIYCARSYVGWLGLFLGFNLSFISSDVLVYLLRNDMSEHRADYPPEQDGQIPNSQGHFFDAPDAFQSAFRRSADRSAGVPSTSETDAELTSEDEVVRLLNCNDHYSALGFARFENIDISLLKREYRKKAMLVHPDKNMGNEKAAEAFKKLQNAYEVLLDTLKRKTYDDELRREELLNYFRRFQTASRKNVKHDIFSSRSAQFEAEDEGLHGDSRRIACKKCNDFHLWTHTERSKSQARWCQDCNDFHQAKDGDGWLEQSLQPFLFGLLHKVDAPHAYVCADSRIYDATEWFICQGMRCPANTHKPSFHVNTSLSAKHANSGKGASSSHRGGGGIPTANLDETMTEEEFFEWLQNAMRSGVFEGGESPSGRGGNAPKSNSSSGGARKKRKGKKQW